LRLMINSNLVGWVTGNSPGRVSKRGNDHQSTLCAFFWEPLIVP
jgi:hypothetical protein